ncbi:MAG: CbiX/SirB N-terminal domain-containing protein [Candidatus Schekmanbacteria bacterium]|nr:CbiX/SirB N-terminal domain-containing protein [Candidatus Schekmanbacteria bacterium]
MKIGVIVLGHGSQAAPANKSLQCIVQQLIRENAGMPIEPAFLQFAEPTLSQSAASLAAQKVNKIIIMPLFLCNGNHVTQDIPKLAAEEAAKYPQIEFVTAASLADDRRLATIVMDKIGEALA